MRLVPLGGAGLVRAGRGWTNAQALAAVLSAGLFICGALMVLQDDTWWHLRCGQMICMTHSVPRTDPFSFALPAGAPWPNHEWLAQVVMYAAYAAGGLALLHVGAAALLAVTALLLFGAMRGGAERRFTLVALIVPWLVAALSARPQLFTLASMAATLWLIARERYLLLPPLFLVWANLHAAVALGGLVLLGCCASALVFDRKRLPRLALVTLLCGCATLVTPLGVHILTFPLESVARLRQLELSEWQAPGWSEGAHLYFWALLTAFLALALGRWRSRRSRTALAGSTPGGKNVFLVPALLMAGMAASCQRNIPLFLMVAAAAASELLPARLPQFAGRFVRSRG